MMRMADAMPLNAGESRSLAICVQATPKMAMGYAALHMVRLKYVRRPSLTYAIKAKTTQKLSEGIRTRIKGEKSTVGAYKAKPHVSQPKNAPVA